MPSGIPIEKEKRKCERCGKEIPFKNAWPSVFCPVCRDWREKKNKEIISINNERIKRNFIFDEKKSKDRRFAF